MAGIVATRSDAGGNPIRHPARQPSSRLVDAAVSLLTDPTADPQGLEASFGLVVRHTDDALALLEPLIDTLNMSPAMKSKLAKALLMCSPSPTGRALDFACHQVRAYELRYLTGHIDSDTLKVVSARQVELAAIHGSSLFDLACHQEPAATALIVSYLEDAPRAYEPIEPALSPGPYRKTQPRPANIDEVVHALVNQRIPDALDELAGLAEQSPEAAMALAAADDVRAIEPLTQLLDHQEPAVQRQAAEYLGSMSSPARIEPLVSLAERTRDEDLRSLAAQAVACHDLDHPFLAEWANDGIQQTEVVTNWTNGITFSE